MHVHAYGDRAVEITLGDDDARVARQVARSIEAAALAGVRECVAGYGAVLAHLDDDVPIAPACAAIERHLAALPPRVRPASNESPEREGALHVIPVLYDGPDLADVAAHAGLTIDEVARRHAQRIYEVEVVGFLPGFAYLGGVDATIAMPRLVTPRPRVPAGSLALADARTAIYPLDSPGGWRILGRMVGGPALFSPDRPRPALLKVGDRVSFERVQDSPASVSASVSVSASSPPTLTVLEVGPLATIQDRGRPGHASSAVPRGGALDDETLRASLAAVGLSRDDAALELPFGGARFRANVTLRASIDGAPAIEIRAGDELVVPRGESAVRYLAIDRGLLVAPVLGSRSTLITARLGGYEGRPLRRGDGVPLGPTRDGSELSARRVSSAPARHPAPTTRGGGDPVLLDCVPAYESESGPQREALTALLQAARTFHVDPRSDRVGTRLAGEPLFIHGTTVPRSSARASRPTARGAVQLPPDGLPIVLGPDGPTTGGYPVLAVLTPAACAALARVRPRGTVRFRRAAF